MAITSFFGGAFFGGEFFNESTAEEAVYKGGRGDNKSGDARKRGQGIYKPTGLVSRRTLKAKTPEVQKRLDQSVDIAAEIAGQMAREMEGERLVRERALTEEEVTREIAALLQKKLRTEEDEVMLLLLMAAAAIQ